MHDVLLSRYSHMSKINSVKHQYSNSYIFSGSTKQGDCSEIFSISFLPSQQMVHIKNSIRCVDKTLTSRDVTRIYEVQLIINIMRIKINKKIINIMNSCMLCSWLDFMDSRGAGT